MSSHCTILCSDANPLSVLTAVKHTINHRGNVKVDDSAGGWSRIVVQTPNSSLVLTRRELQKPGDEFSRMILGLHNYFRQVNTTTVQVKQSVLDRISQCHMAVGIVGEPEFTEEAGHFDIIAAVAQATDAIIWTGHAVLDAFGNPLLDGEGDTEQAQQRSPYPSDKGSA